MAEYSDKAVGVDPQKKSRRIPVWLKIVILGGLLFAAFKLVNKYIVASFSVPTGSMENTIMYGDNLLVNKMYGEPKLGDIIIFEFPGMRDQVEPDQFQYYMKRCVALAGDTLVIRDRNVILNGVEQPRPPNVKFEGREVETQDRFRTFPDGAGFTRDNWGPMRIPKQGDVIPMNDSTFYEWRIFIMREGHKMEKEGERIVIDGKPAASYTIQRDYCFGMGDNRDNSLDSRYWGFIPVDNVAGKAWMVLWSAAGSDRTFKKVE